MRVLLCVGLQVTCPLKCRHALSNVHQTLHIHALSLARSLALSLPPPRTPVYLTIYLSQSLSRSLSIARARALSLNRPPPHYLSLALARALSRFLYPYACILQLMWTGGVMRHEHVMRHSSAMLVYDQGTSTFTDELGAQQQNDFGGDALCADWTFPNARQGVRTGRIVTDIGDPSARERKFSYV